MRADDRGYTLTELVVAMLIFSVVMTIISVSFNRIVTSAAQGTKSAETDIAGLIGLEVLRCDLESAGMGLPWTLPAGTRYRETSLGKVMVPGYDETTVGRYEDVDEYGVPVPPRAVASGNNVGMNGSDYLVLKGSALGMSKASQGWSYLAWSPSGAVVKPSKSAIELVQGNGERVVVLRHEVTLRGATRTLVTTTIVSDGSTSASASPTAFTLHFNKTAIPPDFSPPSPEERYLVYGIAEKDDSGKPVPLSFPYNRADYFINVTDDGPSFCAKGVGSLYKSIISQGTVSPRPYAYRLLDCVADLQVIYTLDSGYHVSKLADGLPPPVSAEDIRMGVKEIRVYLLAQQGNKDAGYLYPLENLPLVVGDAALDRGTTLGSRWSEREFAALDPDWRHYHWKVYSIVVQPKNF